MSSMGYYKDVKKKFALLPLLIKYKKHLALRLMNYNNKWKLNTIHNRAIILFELLIKFSFSKYGLELICKLKQIAIYKNIRRQQRKKLFYLVYPLLKKILIKKGVYFNIWNKRSKFINVSNPIKPLKSFFQLIKRKMSFGKGRRVKDLANVISKHSMKLFYNALINEIKRKTLIYVVFMLRKSLKRYLPDVFSRFRNSFMSQSVKFHSNRKVHQNHNRAINAINDNENASVTSSKTYSNRGQQQLYCNNSNRKVTIEWFVSFTILKLMVIKWKKQSKAICYKASNTSYRRNKIKKVIKADSSINEAEPLFQQEEGITYCTDDIHLITTDKSNKEKFNKLIKAKVLLTEAKKLNRTFFAFVKWTLVSKFDLLTKEKLKTLYNNFQQSYLQAVSEMEKMDYITINENEQMALLNYTFSLFRNKIDRSINSSFGKQLLFK